MDARTKSALLWGAVAGMAFLALYQGYILLGNDGIGFANALGVAAVVGAVASGVSYTLEGRLSWRPQ